MWNNTEFKGAEMLGAIVGDIVGSVYEFDNIKTKKSCSFQRIVFSLINKAG